MIDLSLKFTRSEFSDFSKAIQMLFKCTTILEPDEYLHYYNVRSLSKKVFDKNYRLSTNRSSNATLRININEFESVKYVYTISEPQLNIPELEYNKIIICKFISDLDQQQKSLIHGSQFLLL